MRRYAPTILPIVTSMLVLCAFAYAGNALGHRAGLTPLSAQVEALLR